MGHCIFSILHWIILDNTFVHGFHGLTGGLIRFGTLKKKKKEEAEANAESWILFEQIEAQSTKPRIGPVAFPPFVQGPANSTGRNS